ncbi:MAG TPA: GMC family oxidoreductase [Steroidobacter sp.]|uniref:GMC family oxidoreductase n=1 Tax=Steroidobacter sp. TaxID=1978227 RepID=UPI002ED98B5C
MPLIDTAGLQKEYDVIVVGSGAAGGQTAYTLTLDGAKVLMLEAGRNYVPEIETPMFHTPDQAPLRGTSTLDKEFGFYDATVDGGWQIPGEPYSSASTDADRTFWWWRARMLGGRTNHWGRISLRNGPYDFKPKTRDGLGFDWPISYDDVAPYYDKVEMLIGVYGDNDGYENTPNSPAGCLLPPPKARAGERLIQKHAKAVGVPVIAAHRAVLTQQLDFKRAPALLHPGNPRAQQIVADSMRSRAPCFWATDCGRGCSIKANYQSTTVHLPPAMATGNLDILPNAMVREVEMGKNGRATGVIFIDKTSGKEVRAKGRIIVLAASACESVRILLNSKSSQFPQGLANSSGKVGKYLMDTVGASVSGQIPALEDLPPHNEDGAGGMHVYSPWWLYKEQLAGKLDFARGYHIEIGAGRDMPSFGATAGLANFVGGYGKKFKQDMRRYYGSFVSLVCRGEMIPNEDSYCDIDPQKKDQYGIPTLRFHWKWSEHEKRQAVHSHKVFTEVIQQMGGRVTGKQDLLPGGFIIHEVGGAIMGSDAKSSVVNQWGQTWDVKNLFITDGAPFPSNADKNPTLTIMALAWRSADYMLAAMKRREL